MTGTEVKGERGNDGRQTPGLRVYNGIEELEFLNEVKECYWVMEYTAGGYARMIWGNAAALTKTFGGCTLEQFQAKDLNTTTSKAHMEERDYQYKKVVVDQEMLWEQRTFYPDGKATTVLLEYRPIRMRMQEEKDGAQVEVLRDFILISSGLVQHEDEKKEGIRASAAMTFVNAIHVLFTPEGTPVYQNRKAETFYFGTERQGRAEYLATKEVLTLETVLDICHWTSEETKEATLSQIKGLSELNEKFEIEVKKRERPIAPGFEDNQDSQQDAEVWHRMQFMKTRDPATGKEAVLLSEYDVSELKRVCLDLERAQEARLTAVRAESAARLSAVDAEASARFARRFIASLSHEFRTPLNSVIAFNSLLLDAGLSHVHKDYVSSALTSASALLGVINQVLDYSKLEQEDDSPRGMTLDREPFYFPQLCEEVRDIVASRVSKSKLEFGILCPVKTPCLIGDRFRLRQCLINLCDNAAKFSKGEGGLVKLAICLEEPKTPEDRMLSVSIDVEDNGIGIPEEKQHLLFKPFSQVHDIKCKSKYGGSGLGLAITKKIINTMDGTIECRSKFREGTTFHIGLKMELAEAAESIPPPEFASEKLTGLVQIGMQQRITSQILTQTCGVFGVEVRDLTFPPEDKEAAQQRLLAMLKTEIEGILLMDYEMYLTLHRDVPDLHLMKVLVVGALSDQNKATQRGDLDSICFLSAPVKVSSLYQHLKVMLFNNFMPHAVFRRNSSAGSAGSSPSDQYSLDSSEYTTGSSSHYSPAVHVKPAEPENPESVIRVLIVDDLSTNQKVGAAMVNKVLGKGNAAIEYADDGVVALRKATERGHCYDLILMDIQMPNMDGLECSSRIREWEKGRPVSEEKYWIVAVTAQNDNEDIQACYSSGMDEYCAKPVTLTSLKPKLLTFKEELLKKRLRPLTPEPGA